jgi:hypothetical protein
MHQCRQLNDVYHYVVCAAHRYGIVGGAMALGDYLDGRTAGHLVVLSTASLRSCSYSPCAASQPVSPRPIMIVARLPTDPRGQAVNGGALSPSRSAQPRVSADILPRAVVQHLRGS